MDQTIVSSIIKNAKHFPGKIAIIAGLKPHENRISYLKLKKKIFQASEFLSKKGVSSGDTVVVSASQSVEFIVIYFAIHLLGAISVPIDIYLTSSQIKHVIQECDAKIAFLEDKKFFLNKTRIFSLNSFLNFNCDNLIKRIPPKINSYADILFTSGTTGKPKGVVLTHENILESSKNINNFIQNTSEDIEVLPSPFSHSFGLARLRCNFLAGATVVLVNGFLFPGRIFKMLEQTNATGISFVPAGAAVLLKFGKNKLAEFSNKLKYIEMGSAPMPIEQKKELIRLLPNTKICMHYGSTEASRACFIEFHKDKNYLNSVGKVTPGVNLIIKNENNKMCKVQERGEIMFSGKSISKKYISSKIPLDGKWFLMGDYGYKNEKNYIFLDGRKKDLINIGGKKVSPLEIENIVNQIPSISDCCCVGVQDSKEISGEIIKIFLVLNNCKVNRYSKVSDEYIVSLLRKNLEPYKIPSIFKWINKIPKTSSGKIKRDILKKIIKKEGQNA